WLLFHEASITGFHYNDAITVAESFRYAATTQRLIDPLKPCPYLLDALAYSQNLVASRRKDSCANALVLVSLLEEIADDAISLGNAAAAQLHLDTAQSLMQNSPMKEGRLGGRWNFLKARQSYAGGSPNDLANGNKFLGESMRFMSKCSLWVWQIKFLANIQVHGRISTTSPITARKALELYDYLLREPTHRDWIMEPMDSLAAQVALPDVVMGTNVYDVHELWFSIALELDYKERAFEISELVRRKRFFACDPLFGGRLISLRALFESPATNLQRRNLLDRKLLTVAFPAYAKLSETSRGLKQRIRTLPIAPIDEDQKKLQNDLLVRLEQTSLMQEVYLRSIALSRGRSPAVFPPLLHLKEIQNSLPEGTAELVFFAANGQLYGFMIDRNNFDMWRISARIEAIRKPLSAYLTALGNTGSDKEIAVKDLREETKRSASEAKKWEWKESGNKLLSGLLGGAKKINFKELIIVPDHILWYLPFETLSVKDANGEYRPLIGLDTGDASISIRYAPTAALGVPHKFTRLQGTETFVVAGKLFPKDSQEKAINYTKGLKEEFAEANLGSVVAYVGGPVPGGVSLFMTRIPRLVVFNDIPAAKNDPLGWGLWGASAGLNSASGSRSSSNSVGSVGNVRSRLGLPWGGPRLIVLPGFHTGAENAAKTGNGREIFYSVLAMQANGANTVLLSRWRPGGSSSYDFVKGFLKNYAELPAAEAWRDTVLHSATNSLKFEEEPRLKSSKEDEPLRAEHPFFWGAFMLVDRGEIKDEFADENNGDENENENNNDAPDENIAENEDEIEDKTSLEELQKEFSNQEDVYDHPQDQPKREAGGASESLTSPGSNAISPDGTSDLSDPSQQTPGDSGRRRRSTPRN
ncbi:MAG: hypothetical protein ACRC2T_00275, partial [Thermoguttaceae bacterium]